MSEAPKLCSAGCGHERDRPGQRYCKACHRRYEARRARAHRAAMRMFKRNGLPVPIGTMDDDRDVKAGSAG